MKIKKPRGIIHFRSIDPINMQYLALGTAFWLFLSLTDGMGLELGIRHEPLHLGYKLKNS